MSSITSTSKLYNFFFPKELYGKCLTKAQEILPEAKKGPVAAIIVSLLQLYCDGELEKFPDLKRMLDFTIAETYARSTYKNKKG